MVMWPKTILPSAVAGPVAAKALQWPSRGRTGAPSAGSRNRLPSRPVAVASRAPSRNEVSISALTATMSTRSSGRPSKRAPAAAAPSAMPFISSRYSASNFRRKRALASSRTVAPGVAGRLGAAIGGEGLDEPGDLGGHQAAVLVAALVRFALDVQHDPAGLRIAIARAEALDRGRVGPERLLARARVGARRAGERRHADQHERSGGQGAHQVRHGGSELLE